MPTLDERVSQMRDRQNATEAVVTNQAVETNPDQFAAAREIAKPLGVNPETVANDQQSFETAAKARKIDEIMKRSPVLRAQMSNPEFAKTAHDDVETSAEIEAQITQRSDNPATFRSVLGGLGTAARNLGNRFNAMLLELGRPVLGPIGSEVAAKLTRDADLLEKAARPDFETQTGAALYSGAVSTIDMLPGLAATLGSAAAGAGPITAAITGLTEPVTRTGRQGFEEAKARGATDFEAGIAGASKAGFEGLLEIMPMSYVARAFGKTGFTRFVGEYFARDLVSEELTTIGQKATDFLVANPDATFGQFIKELPADMYQTGVATLVPGATFGTLNLVAKTALRNEEKAAQANANKEYLTKLSDTLSRSKHAERAPDLFERFLQSAGGAAKVDAVYVDPNALAQSGFDTTTLSAETQAAVAESQQAGTDARIPLGEYATRVARSDAGAALLDHVKLNEDGMSAFEAAAFEKERDAFFQSAATEIGELAGADAAFKAGVQEVTDYFTQQIAGTQRFTTDVNRRYAEWMGLFYGAMASREGVSPAELLNTYKLEVQREAPESLFDVLNQPAFHGTPVEEAFKEFSLEKVGTGEGAQAFGHGLYFAESKRVAEGYRNKLSTLRGGQKFGGEPVDISNPVHVASLESSLFGRDKALAEARTREVVLEANLRADPASTRDSVRLRELRDVIAVLANPNFVPLKPDQPGALYEVEIPDEVSAAMLDWDISIGKQTEIRAGLIAVADDYGLAVSEVTSGERFYEALAKAAGGDRQASAALEQAGVPGIKYLDAFSRKKGEGTRNFVVFNPKDVKVVSINDQPVETLFQRRKPTSDAGHKREATTGRYVGAPDWIGASPQQLAALRKKLDQLAGEGEPYRFWYENSARTILKYAGGDVVEAEKIVQLIAIFSPNTNVPSNTTKALRAYYQWKAGQPIQAGFEAANKKAHALLVEGKPWSGRKTNSFYQNLMVEIDPAAIADAKITQDLWMMIAFDYGATQIDQGPKYDFMDRELRRIAGLRGWSPHQVQAAVWTSIKARVDGQRTAISDREVTLGIREKLKGGRPGLVVSGKEKEHLRLAHEMAMAAPKSDIELSKAGADFASALQNRLVQMSWEATPGRSTGILPGLLHAPIEQRVEYQNAVLAVLSPGGKDAIAELAKAPTGETLSGFSAWEGDVGAGFQTFIPAVVETRQKGRVAQVSREAMNRAAALRGYVLSQEAVAWHHPIFTAAKRDHNAVEIKTNRALTFPEMRMLYDALNQRFGTWDLAPAYTQDGARILNFVDGLSNSEFQEGFKAVLAALPPQFGGGNVTLATYKSDGDLISNDWKEHPDGKHYADIFAAGRADILERADALRDRVAAVNEEFARKYGWDSAVFKQEPVRRAEPVRPAKPNAGKFLGVHFSAQQRTELSSAAFGTGIKAAERHRVADATDERIKHRIYFYVDEGRGIVPEPGLGGAVHNAVLDNIYDTGIDPEGIGLEGLSENDQETRILDLGYDGYYVPGAFGGRQGGVVLLGPRTQQVAPGAPGGLGVLRRPGKTEAQVAAGGVANAILSDARLPAGAVTPAQWAELLAQDERYAAALPYLQTLPAEETIYRSDIAKGVLRAAQKAPIPEPKRASLDDGRREFFQSAGKRAMTNADFKAWFGESKIKTRSGKPLLLYHGTNTAFETHKGFVFMTPDPELAESYALDRASMQAWLEKRDTDRFSGANIRPVFMRSTDPLIVNAKGAQFNAIPVGRVPKGVLDEQEYVPGVDYVTSDVIVAAAASRGYDAVVFRRLFDPPDLTYEQGFDFEPGDVYVALDPKNVRSALGSDDITALEQGGGDRGQISFAPDIAKNPSTLALLSGADLSTFFHESGHFFLEVLFDMASKPGAPPSIVDMSNNTLKWFGVKTIADWKAMPLDQRRPSHEKFARGIEAYLFEGVSPSAELGDLFGQARGWMMAVYPKLEELDVELDSEIRGVFARLVATDEQIAAKQYELGYEPLFKSAEQAGMTAEQWADYQQKAQGATEASSNALAKRSLRAMAVLRNARSKAIRGLIKDAKAKRAAVKEEVTAEIDQRPIYQALDFLKTGRTKLSLDSLKALYGDHPAAPWRYMPTGKFGLVQKDGGFHENTVANMFGFASGDELVRKLLDADGRNAAIEALTDQRMLERYGDLLNPTAVNRAADAAVHNELRADMLAAEISAIEKRTGPANILKRAAKAFAQRTLAGKKVKDVRPNAYRVAEQKAGRSALSAMKKGDTATASAARRQQLVNGYLFKEAESVVDEIEKIVERFKKFASNASTREAIDVDFRDQIDSMLERFDFRQATQAELAKRKSLAEWITKQEERGLEPAISEELRNEAFRKHHTEMTVEELRGLADAIKNIEHLGRLKTKLLTAKDQREFSQHVDEAVNSIRANATKTVPADRSSNRGWLVGAKRLGKWFLASHRKFASFVREMDGFKDDGVVWNLFVRTMNERGDFEAKERAAATKKLSALMAPVLKDGGLGKKVFVGEVNASFTREELLSIALNSGNETNLERVLTGKNWTEAQHRAVLNQLTKTDMDFVQGVWDYLESFRPQIAAKERAVTGVEPEWVAPHPLTTQHGTYRGGYYPIKYDPFRSSRSEADTAAEVERQMTRGLYTRAQTRRGHLKARVESVGRELRYDLGVMTQHVDQVIHDLAWHEWLIDANRLLGSAGIDGAVRDHYGPEVLREMKAAVRDIAVGEAPAQTAFEGAINHVRKGATVAGLGWNVFTSLLQPLGLTQSAVRIGPKWVAIGVGRFLGSPLKAKEAIAFVDARSDFMTTRGLTMQRELNEILNVVTDKTGGKMAAFKASYFYLIQAAQKIADYPTWIGAYEKAMSSPNMDENTAAALADQAVRDAQGAGQVADLAGVQRGGPLLKLWTNFYSYFNTTYNLAVERGKAAKMTPAGMARLSVDYMLLFIVPAVLGTMLREAFRGGGGDDDDELVKKLAADSLAYMAGTMIGVREIAGVVSGFGDYQGPAGARFFSESAKLATQIGQGEVDAAAAKAAVNTAGVLFQFPAGQIYKSGAGVLGLATGEESNPYVLITGPRVE